MVCGDVELDVEELEERNKRQEELRWQEESDRRIEKLKKGSTSDIEPVSGLKTGPSTSNSGQRIHPGIDIEDHETNIQMDLTLYKAAKQPLAPHFLDVLERVANEKGLSLSAVFDQVSPIGSTYLHVAAGFNNAATARLIAYHCPPLITKKNFNGDTPLHLTARAGYISISAELLDLWKDAIHLPSAEGGDERQTEQENLLLRLGNERGNTALHEALLNSHDQIARNFIKADPEVAFYLNNDQESPLYLAAKAGSKECVSFVFSFPEALGKMIEQVKVGKSPVHAAISSRNKDALDLMLQKAPEFIHLVDEEGRSPVHYAASMGYLEEVQLILDKFPHSANGRDRNGLLPIHWASINGHVSIIKEMLLHSPDPGELLDQNGYSILHFAAKRGKHKVVSYMLKHPAYEGLINMTDKQGNTPLHLAAMHWHPKTVTALTWDSRVNLTVVNNRGMTALDAARDRMDSASSFQQRLTWAALRGVPRARPRKLLNVDGQTAVPMKQMKPHNYKDRVNTLLLVSTLVATVTFAAGFTVPGGYNNSDPYQGMATMLGLKKFHVFIFCDTIAMFTSIIVAVSLIWAQLGDLNLVLGALRLAFPLIGVALAMMSLAFMAGISVVVSKLRWLDNAILIMGSIFLVILVVLFSPLCFSLGSKYRLLRKIFYYPFLVLIWVTNADPGT
ncbi:protein ACCELERATED CELL DEATH 6-like [Coffea arabica]|uniref:Protein ACCELERATED CELL DEATH 6-like n=1 Tax=Coffea arabica TaxID=13443 RepID=A0A6P6SCC5_COFAR|nr:protein ACCELERATED CELL DEATH 6-like [Coffea arabica]